MAHGVGFASGNVQFWPAGHVVQDVLPVLAANEPDGHGMGSTKGLGQKKPAGQAVHTPAREYWPDTQRVVEPVVVQAVPRGQVVQVNEP